MNSRVMLAVAMLMTAWIAPAWSQGQMSKDAAPMGAMDHGAMPGMDHGGMDHGTGSMPAQGSGHDMPMDMDDEGGMHGMTGGMHGGGMQGGSPPPDARDPHAYSDGFDFGPIPRPRFADEKSFGSLLMDNLEGVRSDGNNAAAYDLQAWYGRDYDRAVLKAEGEVDDGRLQEARTELLWSHAVATFWDAQLGARIDSGEDPDRTWLAFGVQGLAPYWFEVEASGYLGEQGRSALRLDASYELLLTQRLILQPRLEANAYGKRDAERALGTGLSDLTAALRLRYEIRREFAPYVGVEWVGKYGGTADFARAAGQDTKETRAVAGVRFWF